jgi:hypothetical protein
LSPLKGNFRAASVATSSPVKTQRPSSSRASLDSASLIRLGGEKRKEVLPSGPFIKQKKPDNDISSAKKRVVDEEFDNMVERFFNNRQSLQAFSVFVVLYMCPRPTYLEKREDIVAYWEAVLRISDVADVVRGKLLIAPLRVKEGDKSVPVKSTELREEIVVKLKQYLVLFQKWSDSQEKKGDVDIKNDIDKWRSMFPTPLPFSPTVYVALTRTVAGTWRLNSATENVMPEWFNIVIA